ncbi:MAG: hypothetical protein L7S44_02115 [Flavobacteriaceae bacterium]|nr:hypothetical protein [Flavobacteriaceae bacterium]
MEIVDRDIETIRRYKEFIHKDLSRSTETLRNVNIDMYLDKQLEHLKYIRDSVLLEMNYYKSKM